MAKTQVAVIGAGTGGYSAAFRAADLGLQVTLIDRGPTLGGVCLNRGCIPSKALLHVAALLNEAREAEGWGVTFGEPKIDVTKLNEWKKSVVGKMTGGLAELVKRRKITYQQGSAKFVSSTALTVEKAGGGTETLEFEHAVLATGSRPTVIPSLQTKSNRVVDSTGALELTDIPKSMLVVGGGYIGLELGTVYDALSTRVSVVEMMPGLLPGVDRDLVSYLARRLQGRFEKIMLETTVVSLEETKAGVRAKFKGKDGDSEAEYEKVLIAVGRRPNTQNLGLETTKVQVNERGFVVVDEQRRTAEGTIFAVGDIAGEPMLAHKAVHEGIVAAEVISGQKVAFEPHAIPAVVFTDPEIAWCGLTQTQAEKERRTVKVAKFPWGASGRATTLGRNDGMTKLLVDPETERVLGVGIVGAGAGELIAEGALAVEMAALASDLRLTIHPHPTLSETIMEAAETFFGQSLHVYAAKRS